MAAETSRRISLTDFVQHQDRPPGGALSKTSTNKIFTLGPKAKITNWVGEGLMGPTGSVPWRCDELSYQLQLNTHTHSHILFHSSVCVLCVWRREKECRFSVYISSPHLSLPPSPFLLSTPPSLYLPLPILLPPSLSLFLSFLTTSLSSSLPLSLTLSLPSSLTLSSLSPLPPLSFALSQPPFPAPCERNVAARLLGGEQSWSRSDTGCWLHHAVLLWRMKMLAQWSGCRCRRAFFTRVSGERISGLLCDVTVHLRWRSQTGSPGVQTTPDVTHLTSSHPPSLLLFSAHGGSAGRGELVVR